MEPDEYDQVKKQLEYDRILDKKLAASYEDGTTSGEKFYEEMENRIVERIRQKCDRNSIPVNSTIFRRFGSDWSSWILAVVPENNGDRNLTARTEGHSGYRFQPKVMKRKLEDQNLLGNGIMEWGKVEWKRFEGREDPNNSSKDLLLPEEVVMITHSENVENRISEYCRNGSHRSKARAFNKALRDGFAFLVRGRRTETPVQDKDVIIKKYRYPWREVYPDVLILSEDPDSKTSDITGAIVLKSDNDQNPIYRHEISLHSDLSRAMSIDSSGFFEEDEPFSEDDFY